MKTIDEVIMYKLDLFINSFIVNKYDLNNIHWFFSLSGGKDSFTMAKAIELWYSSRSFIFNATGIFVDQWDDNVKEHIKKEFSWLNEVIILDGKNKTSQIISELNGYQAPCRKCSDLRHDITDEFLYSRVHNGRINFLCRGLHLSDMAVSMLWRYIWGCNPYEGLKGKGKPIVHLFDNSYLVKPLSFVREYESQEFAMFHSYLPVTCDCRALKYPGRRDIIEESVLKFYRSQLWEFDICGVTDFLFKTLCIDSVDNLKNNSKCGLEIKESIIPMDYFDYSINQYKKKNKDILDKCSDIFDYNTTLDEFGYDFLENKPINYQLKKIPVPKLIINDDLTEFEILMISTLGPFWGFIAFKKESRDRIIDLQFKLYGIKVDINWSQTIDLLLLYINRGKLKKLNTMGSNPSLNEGYS